MLLLISCHLNILAQGKIITGVILDKTGETVIGASVLVKGTTNGTITDVDGNFTLNNVQENAVLQVSFVGYKTQDIALKGQSNVKVTLEEDTEVLDEVVVIGYGFLLNNPPLDIPRLITEIDPDFNKKLSSCLFVRFLPAPGAVPDTAHDKVRFLNHHEALAVRQAENRDVADMELRI